VSVQTPSAFSRQEEILVPRVKRVEGAPVVTIRAVVSGGARVEEIPGQALVTGRLLAEGTKNRDWWQIAQQAEAYGMSVMGSGSFECHGLSVDALAADWRLALEWTAEMLFESAFPEERMIWLARQAAAELESLADQPEVRCSWQFQESLYGSHPLARRIQGDPESLLRLTPADCESFHQRARQAGMILAVAGPVDVEEVEAAVESLFGACQGPRLPFEEPAAPELMGPQRSEVSIETADQAHVFLGHLTVPRSHPDVTAMEILAVILGAGAGLVGRIPGRIREQEGLAYIAQANTVSGAGLDAGRLTVYAGTSPSTLDRVETAAREELERVVADGVTEAELEEARSFLLGREPFRRETARQWADILLESVFYGVPVEDLEWRRRELLRIDRASLEAVARRHLHPELLTVTVGRSPKAGS